MKRVIVGVAALSSVVGCSKQAEKPQAEPPKPAIVAKAQEARDKAVATVDAAKNLVDGANKPALTKEAYKALILGLEKCSLNGYEIDFKCPGMQAMQEGLKNNSTPLKDLVGMNAALGAELIGHSSPAIRVKAAGLMSSVVGTGAGSQDTIVAAAAKETDPGVLQAFIRTVANDGAKNPKVAELLLKAADHTDVKVRLQAVYALTSGWNKELPGGAAKLISLAEKDADPGVRHAACEYAGNLGDKAFMPLYEKQTATTDDKDMYAACMKGLVKMFHNYPLFETLDESAYKLFLKRLSDKPRSVERPPWTVTSAFQYSSDEKNTKLVEWKKKATWWKPADVQKVLVDIVGDKSANWMARNGAVTSLLGLGATKAELEALKKGLDEKAPNEKYILKAIDDALPKAK